jgi:hypothetical protein
MLSTLEACGFGPKSINQVIIQNKNLKADVLVNGFRTEKVNIEQSVKQGEVLSCSLFILCMDPLIRKINTDNQIQGVRLEDGTALDKVCGYADDIVFIIKDNAESLKTYLEYIIHSPKYQG